MLGDKLYLKGIRILNRIKDLVNDVSFSQGVRRGRIHTAKIIPNKEAGERRLVFKPHTNERIEQIPIYNFISEGSFTIDYPEINLWEISEAVVVGEADYVILNNNCVIWPKYYNYNYPHNIPLDANYIKEEKGFLCFYYSGSKEEINVAFSLLGVFSNVWAHAVVEYFPKLVALKEVLESNNDKITVLVPPYKDEQLKKLIFDFLNPLNVTIHIVEKGEAVKVKKLFYMERTAKFTDNEYSIYPGDCAIPTKVSEILKCYLIDRYPVKLNDIYRKLYLDRSGGNGKTIEEAGLIKELFVNNGYKVVEPHKVSLEEKITMFQSAEMIAGPLGGAFTNLFLCRPGTKVLMFSNFHRQFENYLSMVKTHFNVDILYIYGYDNKNVKNPTHCSYSIPVKKVKDAAKMLGIL